MQVKRFIPLLAFAVFALLLWWGLNSNRDIHAINSPLIDKPVPQFQLPLLFNPQQSADKSELTGEVTLLNFWGSWCYVCIQEHPFLTELASQGVNLVGVNYRDQRADALEWLGEHGNPFSQVWADSDGRFAIDMGVYAAPETYLVDKQGVIRYKRIGLINQLVWQQEMEPLYRQLMAE
ncbi:DsbE family thiol:disulfide interchange protein [Porticoccus sp. W117]|uniref:DsbE family thiol:disulfide interchange protein n=1 Tax=Porticoccus sp. W117 TaxID=3054777 RepID=UPI002599D23A|nr:DsbE family thiol:disulfide interchange protein [Porticoccus sp. W117]MDM3869777.1 DsbE family thiol:disulfide interchange protein [Porticoccus sp. W117]